MNRMNKKPLVAIVGRPNVGKSTLFNRILGRRVAIVQDEAGVTRDRNIQHAEYRGKVFLLADTGGLQPGAEEGMGGLVMNQARRAVEEADVLIFLMDGKEGINPLDIEIFEMLRKSGKPVACAVNKMDSNRNEDRLFDFYRLGGGDLYPISSEHGRGVDELLERILPFMGADLPEEEKALPKIAVLGRPNTGKSTLLNSLLKAERLVTSEIPGTTRDAIDIQVDHQGQAFLFIDTAGVRKRGKVKDPVEYFGVHRAMRSIKRCDLGVLLLDIREGVTDQELKIAEAIRDAGKGCLIGLNKADLIPDEPGLRKKMAADIQSRFPFLEYIPVIFLSGKTGKGISGLFQGIREVLMEYERRVPTSDLNRLFEKLIRQYPHPLYRGKEVKLLYMTQISVRPPTFVVFMKRRRGLRTPYVRYLERGIRKSFSFKGAPIRILFRQSRSSDS